MKQNEPATQPLPDRVDLAIIGAGLGGLAVANALGRTARQTLLLDADEPGRTTAASLGIVRVGPALHLSRLAAGHGPDAARATFRAGLRNRELLENLATTTPGLGYRQTGSVRFANDVLETDELRRSVRLLRDWNRNAEFGAAGDFLSQPPARFEHAALHPDDAVVDPAALVQLLLDRAQASGLVIHAHTRVEKLEENGAVRIVTPKGETQAELVVVTTESLLPQLVPFCRFKIVPMRAQALFAKSVRPSNAVRDSTQAWTATHGYEMWRLHEDGGVSITGSRRLPIQQELGVRAGTTDEVQTLLEDNLREFPFFSEYEIQRRWSGVQAVSCDGLPLVGPVPGRGRVLVLGGFGLNALGFVLVGAEAIAELVLDGRSKTADPFSPRRFL